MKRLDGKVALITGAAGGIGRAAARLFALHGARLVLADIDKDALHAAAEDLPDGTLCRQVDVADEQSMRACVAACIARHGQVDIGLLNAGIEGRVAALHETVASDFDRVLAVNVRGVYLGLASLIPRMRHSGGGSVIITSSTGGLNGAAGLGAYVASKHAVIGLMKTAALENAAHRIRVNAIAPGPVETRMMRSIEQGTNPDDPAACKAKTMANVPMGRYGEPHEIAQLMLFLASEESSYCTGAVYLADGGRGAGSRR